VAARDLELVKVQRWRLRVAGTVQGVGFRPFVHRQAQALGLRGFVLNDSSGVLIDAEGSPSQLAELRRRLTDDPPPLARVESVTTETGLPASGHHDGFTIVQSDDRGSSAVPVSVDVATCPACLDEVGDPTDRRYRYPFTNCTDCGPRYTIVRSVPYDRPATTLAGFRMCKACQAEYDDPAGRRFHAQPNACPQCGPSLCWRSPSGEPLAVGDEALSKAVEALRHGAVVAVKGVGGYHLAADATDRRAVTRLRRRKARDDKPFAVMVADVETARRFCLLDESAEEALSSRRRPIVLAPRRTRPGDGGGGLEPAVAETGPSTTDTVVDEVAPGLADLGLMLPYSPLHHLLMEGVGRPLVMTSGNVSDEPIAFEEDDAIACLGPMVDGILTHDRPIYIRCDDSVIRSTSGRPQSIRRSRGYAPEPLILPAPGARHVLAVGAELKSTVSVVKQTWLVTSHHIGDLEHLPTYRSFLQAIDHLCGLFGVEPEIVAHDLHPEYLSTKWAHDSGATLVGVQHHHAHVASCMVEHRRLGPVLGVAFDGLGYGDDGTLWGGEFLVADLARYRRVGHLLPIPMPGGSAAIRHPWRMALAWVAAAAGMEEAARLGADTAETRAQLRAVLELVERGTGLVTSSAGRLFDAVAALLGLRRSVTYEGQAAVELEALARRARPGEAAHYKAEISDSDGLLVLDPRPVVADMLADVTNGADGAAMAAGFHLALGNAVADMAGQLAERAGLSTVALSGGVFQNVLLSERASSGLASRGLEVLLHHHVPPNDGGISVGQAAVAAVGEAQA